jgi:hypothetical protein
MKEKYFLFVCDWKKFEQIRGAERPGMQSQPGAANLLKPIFDTLRRKASISD